MNSISRTNTVNHDFLKQIDMEDPSRLGRTSYTKSLNLVRASVGMVYLQGFCISVPE